MQPRAVQKQLDKRLHFFGHTASRLSKKSKGGDCILVHSGRPCHHGHFNFTSASLFDLCLALAPQEIDGRVGLALPSYSACESESRVLSRFVDTLLVKVSNVELY